MKHILIVETPDTIPDPEFLIEARCKGTLDEREPVEFREAILPDGEKILAHAFKVLPGEKRLNRSLQGAFIIGATWFKSLLQ